jgi:hypothetical protein
MSCDDKSERELCVECSEEDCISHPKRQASLDELQKMIEDLDPFDEGARSVLEAYDSHLKAVKVLVRLFNSKIHPAASMKLSFKVESGVGENGESGVRVFAVEDFEIPFVAISQVFDPILQNSLRLVEKYGRLLNETNSVMSQLIKLKSVMQQAAEEEKRNQPEESELN